MNENERIRLIRVTNKMNQTEFGAKIGIKTSSVSEIERGRCAVSQQVHTAVCREFNVSEAWLRTGEGEMFAARSREDELSAAVNSILSGEDSEFRRRLIVALSRFSHGDWQRLERELRFILDGESPPVPVRAAPPEVKNPHEYTREEFLEAMGREWDLMKGDTPLDTGSGSSGTATA